MDQVKGFLRFFFGIPITLLALGFIGKILYENSSILLPTLQKTNLILLILGIACFVAFFATKGIIWLMLLRTRGHSFDNSETLMNYSVSEIKRYIPGSIFAFIGRVDSHSKIVSKTETLKGIGIEAILLVLSAITFSFPAFFYFLNGYGILISFVIAITSFGLFLKLRKVINLYVNHFLLFLLAWFFYGLGCTLVTLSVTMFDLHQLSFVVSFFVLAWLGGYLFVIAPMGLGVRETIVTLGLVSLIPFPVASIVALITRVCMVAGEILFLLACLITRKAKANRVKKRDRYLIIVILLSIIYFIFFSFLSIQKHNSFYSGRFDLGNMTQTIWNTSQGRFFTLTNPDGIQNISRLAVHSDFILILFAPLYLIFPSPLILLISQTFILALGGIVVYFLANSILKSEKISMVLSVSYFLNPWLHEQNLFDFHAVTIATTTLLLSFYFLIKKRYFWMTLFLLISTATKENIFLVSSLFGLFLYFKSNKKLFGISIFVLSIFAFFYISNSAIPAARGSSHFVLKHYSYLGASVPEILSSVVTKPNLIVKHFLNFSTLQYLHRHFIPTGYLSIFSPIYLLFSLPEAAIYLLSQNFEYRSNQYHFGAAIIPFIYISTIYSLQYLKKRKPKLYLDFSFHYILLAALFSCYYYSPLIGMKNADTSYFKVSNIEQINSYLRMIPENASVSSSNNIGAHLSHRENIYVVPLGMDIADYIVLYKENSEIQTMVNFSLYNKVVIDKRNSFFLFKRKILTVCANCIQWENRKMRQEHLQLSTFENLHKFPVYLKHS